MLIAIQIMLLLTLVLGLVAAIDFQKPVDPAQAVRGTAFALASIAALVILHIWG